MIYDLNRDANIFNNEEYSTIEKLFNFKLEMSEVELFVAVPSMISKSLISYDNLINVFTKSNIHEIIVEDKFDGERIQV